MLAEDGRRFSCLRTEQNGAPWYAKKQVWIGDAVRGSTRQLSTAPEGIVDQTITGWGIRGKLNAIPG